MEKKEGDLKKSIYGLAQRRDRLRAENSRLMALNSLSILEALEDTSQLSDVQKLENSTRSQARIKSDKADPQELPTPKTPSAREIEFLRNTLRNEALLWGLNNDVDLDHVGLENYLATTTSPESIADVLNDLTVIDGAEDQSEHNQSDKFTKMKQRKNARKEHAEKKVQTVIVHNDYDLETPYDVERVLLELGEFETDSNKKAKVERKQDVIPGQQNSPQPQLLIQPHMPMASALAQVQGMPVGSSGGQIQPPGSQ